MAHNTKRAAENSEMFVRRVQKNIRRLRPWITAEGISCYRIYDRDIPEFPVTVDWYEGRLHAAFYVKDESERQVQAVKRWLYHLAEALSIPHKSVFLKQRQRHASNQ